MAYGLPPDEGSRMPILVPELDVAPVHEHDRLPSVEGDDFIADDMPEGSFEAVRSPPDDFERPIDRPLKQLDRRSE